MSLDSIKAAAVCVFFGGVAFYNAIKRHRQARKIQDTPTSKVASAAVGAGEFEGFAWHAEEKYKTPAGMDAVYYSFQIQQQQKRGSGKDRRTEWVTVFALNKGQSFYLVDPTGLAEVHLGEAEINLEAERQRLWRNIPLSEQQKILQDVAGLGIAHFPPSNFLWGLFSVKTRIVENEILVGSPVYALGNFAAHSSPTKKHSSQGLSQFASRVFDFEKRAYRKLTGLLDKNGDGKVDSTENKVGYSMLAKVSINKAAIEKQNETEFQVHGAIVSSEHQKLLVADSHQSHLLERLNRFLWFKFFGGAALMTLGLIIFLGPNLASLKLKKSNSNRQPAASVASTSQEVDTLAAEAPRLHNECVAGQVASCARLIEKHKVFELTEVNLKYYRQQLCHLDRRQCP